LFEEITRRLSDLNLNRAVGILSGIASLVVAFLSVQLVYSIATHLHADNSPVTLKLLYCTS